MKIHLATDHAGFDIKEQVKSWLVETGYEVVDHGANTFDVEDDYPDFITPCAQVVSENPDDFGIIFGGSGQGEAMAANRITGIRAGVFYGKEDSIVTLLREHNNANVLSIGVRFISDIELVKKSINTFLITPFSELERHVRRINKF
jgi:ribose 5-phosphate isomerase B